MLVVTEEHRKAAAAWCAENTITSEVYAQLLATKEALRVVRDKLSYVEEVAVATDWCPCCGYFTLEQRNVYEICSICFWEDGGGIGPDGYSIVNRLTLAEARDNYERVGAYTPEMLPHVRKPYPIERLLRKQVSPPPEEKLDQSTGGLV